MSRVEREENPRRKVGENEKLIRTAGGRWAALRAAMLAIWLGRRRGLGGRLARLRYDILRGTFLVSGQRIYRRKWMAAKKVIVLEVRVSGYSLSLSSVTLCVTTQAS